MKSHLARTQQVVHIRVTGVLSAPVATYKPKYPVGGVEKKWNWVSSVSCSTVFGFESILMYFAPQVLHNSFMLVSATTGVAET